MKIVEYLALFMVEYNIQKAPHHLVHAVLKSIVDLDQLIIVIMAVANHQGLGTPVSNALFYVTLPNIHTTNLALGEGCPLIKEIGTSSNMPISWSNGLWHLPRRRQ